MSQPHSIRKAVEEVRRGYVLVAVLLLLLAVTGVGHTLLVMTRAEFLVSRARWDVLAPGTPTQKGAALFPRVEFDAAD